MVFWITVCVSPHALCGSGASAGVDSIWGQRKLEARKIFENAAESFTTSVYFAESANDTEKIKRTAGIRF
jgi:hypothetical protein